MASKKTLNAKNLEALGAERLAELLLENSGGDAALKRRLRLELAAAAGPAEVAREVRKRLATLAKARSFVEWNRQAAFVADLDTQREAIVTRMAKGDPTEALDLMWRFMALAGPCYERCDGGTRADNGRAGAHRLRHSGPTAVLGSVRLGSEGCHLPPLRAPAGRQRRDRAALIGGVARGAGSLRARGGTDQRADGLAPRGCPEQGSVADARRGREALARGAGLAERAPPRPVHPDRALHRDAP